MKTIALKTFTNVKPGYAPEEQEGITVTSRELIRQISNQAEPGKGLVVAEMQKRIRILNQLDATPSDAAVVRLEDSEYDTLKAILKNFPWAFTSPVFLEFCEDVDKAVSE